MYIHKTLESIKFACCRKKKNKEKKFKMRWANAEDFMELSVMPRMLLDHLPENLEEALEILIKQQEELPVML